MGRYYALPERALLDDAVLRLECGVDYVTAFGVASLTFMMLMYALESRGRRFILAFAVGCALSSVYGFVSGAWPFGAVEAVWTIVGLRRFLTR